MTEHPEWFTTCRTGRIAYAENPPKKYQDIYPINFDNDPSGIRAEVLRIVSLWIAQGVTIFRVDNPHTKPLLLGVADRRRSAREHPDVVFLAEAFTRPADAARARRGRVPAVVHLLHLAQHQGGARGVPRRLADDDRRLPAPNLFVNTPDILTAYLQFGGRPAYKIRAALAATAAPTLGRLRGLRAVEDVARAGRRREHRQREVRVQARDWAALAAEPRRRSLLRRT